MTARLRLALAACLRRLADCLAGQVDGSGFYFGHWRDRRTPRDRRRTTPGG